MNSTWGASRTWALRILFFTLLLSLPLLVEIGNGWLKYQAFTEMYEITQKKLQAHQQAARKIHEKLTKQRRLKRTLIPELQQTFPIGAALSNEVSLLMLSFNFEKREARLEVAARSLPTLLDFTERLQQIPAQVNLQNHRLDQTAEDGWPIKATLNIHLFAEDQQ